MRAVAVGREEKCEARQFWLRTLLAIGILWGFLPFVMAPFITRGPSDTYFDVSVSVINSLTMLPASVLAFWRRRAACVWLSVNGVLLGAGLAEYLMRMHQFHAGMILQVAGPIVYAILLDVFELQGWPPALNRRSAGARRG